MDAGKEEEDTAGDGVELVVMERRGLQAAELAPPKVPFLHEIWTWEGDTTILPRKWSTVVQAAFGDFGEELCRDSCFVEHCCLWRSVADAALVTFPVCCSQARDSHLVQGKVLVTASV